MPPKFGTFCFAFTPTPSMLGAFAELCEDTHRIHVDLAYAKSEGYPGIYSITLFLTSSLTLFSDLVVQVPLQLIVILDVMAACVPDGLLFRAVDYRVINPLFSGHVIKVYRQWIHGLDKDDDSPVTLDDFITRTTPPKFQFQPEEITEDVQKVSSRPHFRRQGRRAKLKRMALFWTATEDGTVGTVALVILSPRPGKLLWKLDHEGYLFRTRDPESSGSKNREHDDGDEKADDVKAKNAPEGYYQTSAEPCFNEQPGFDSLGRPITDQTVSVQGSSTNGKQQPGHPWSLQDADEEGLEEERLERIKKAEVLVKSRELLRRLFDDEDDRFTI